MQSTRPVAYVNYDFPSSDASESIEADHVWTTIPSGSETDGNGVFASSQFWLEASPGGYMGSQVHRPSGLFAKQEVRQFIFSCWDADPSHQVAFEGSNCDRFKGEGTGSHCTLQLDVKLGVKYTIKKFFAGSDANGAKWTGIVTDTSTMQEHLIGSLVYPHYNGFEGFGRLQVSSSGFLEYYAGGDCDGAVRTDVGIFGPYFHDRAMPPLQAYAKYAEGPCERSLVDACIPGLGCSAPGVHMAGGKGVARDTADGQALWTPSPAPSPVPAPSPGQDWWYVSSVASGRCLDVAGGDGASGTAIWTWDCAEITSQRWAMDGGQLFTWIDRERCVDIPFGDFSSQGVAVAIWDCNGAPQQQWSYEQDGSYLYTSSTCAGEECRCLDMGGGDYNGATVFTWECNSNENQQWWFSASPYQAVGAMVV